MSSLRASGVMHRGPRFEFARLLASPGPFNWIQLAWDHSPQWEKKQKTGSNTKNIGEQSGTNGGLGYLSTRFSADFFFSPTPISSLFPRKRSLVPSLTWEQAQFERFSYILSNGYR